MTVTLTCKTCHREFQYTVVVVSGNLGGASKMVKLSVFEIDRHELQSAHDVELKEGDELLLKSTADTEETEHYRNSEHQYTASVLRVTPKLLQKNEYEFSIKCPWGHWNRYTLDTDGQ